MVVATLLSPAHYKREYVSKLNELDLDHHENGCGVDELRAHVFLEKFDEVY